MIDQKFDRPVWNTLSTVHAPFSIGNDRARRFEDGVNAFAAAKDESDESLAALARLVPENGYVFVIQVPPIVVPEGARAALTSTGAQMFLEKLTRKDTGGHRIERLTDADAPEMLALATLTKPGPFFSRTHLLGRFWGVKENGRLIAMAGERFRHPGYTEISGVCTHPDHLGRGLAHALCRKVAEEILAGGEVPYLHVFTTNTRAIRVYENLGFRTRKIVNAAMLERA